ncbi:hypothetical protein PE066_18995 [Ramlibacter tataouinensis]|uniref:hypothetical protein n=1 Tax=Ramlibacter tataouinensis TaxID=94132 RepID=UPI0022F3F425|nr:hypothetical protein [Ramlibacter tataouinensis]WBY01527.1 hypothetical protein PE066_18995 [Ramlibacter tataouinensis]
MSASTSTSDQVDNVIYPEQLARAQPSRGTSELLNLPDVRAFFHESHFGLGRHNGAVLRSRESLQLGKSEIVSRFQNILRQIVQGKQLRLGRLEDMKVSIDGIETAMTNRIDAACSFLRREIETCMEQIALAEQHSGWVAEALNHYEMGFRQGLAHVIRFEALLQGE